MTDPARSADDVVVLRAERPMSERHLAESVAPYYVGRLVTIYHGRAEDVLPTLAKSSIDLIATDPPYGVSYQSNWGRQFDVIANDDGSLDWHRILTECLRVLRRRRHIYAFGGLGFGDTPIGGRATLIWDKGATGMGDLSSPWGPAHEPIDFGVAHFSKAERDQGRGGLAARLRQGSVIRVTRPTAGFIHPNEKPVALMRQLVEASSCVGETVLDPFLGSGSTAVAAVLSGRRCVGIEVEERYAELAVNRVAEIERIAAMLDAPPKLAASHPNTTVCGPSLLYPAHCGCGAQSDGTGCGHG